MNKQSPANRMIPIKRHSQERPQYWKMASVPLNVGAPKARGRGGGRTLLPVQGKYDIAWNLDPLFIFYLHLKTQDTPESNKVRERSGLF